MRPPICAICHKDLEGNAGGLIYFSKGEDDLNWDKKMREEFMVGHPPYAEWFCEKHVKIAKEFQNLQRNEAIRKIKEFLKN